MATTDAPPLRQPGVTLAAAGPSLGTLTIDGHLEVSADGQHFVDDSPETTLTFRNANGAVTAQIAPYQDAAPNAP